MEAGAVSGGWLLRKVLGPEGRVGVWGRLPSAPPAPPSAPTELVVKVCSFPREGLAEVRRRSWREQLRLLADVDGEGFAKPLGIPSDLLAGLAPFNPSGLPPLCLEYARGGDLRRLLDDPANANGLREADLRTVLRDVGEALARLHSARIAHRDLKPENVLLYPAAEAPDGRGSDFVCKLTDLEYAARSDSASALANPAGHSRYAAPELLSSKSPDPAVDRWSFGVIAFEAACGTRPFLPDSPIVLAIGHAKNKSDEDVRVYEDADGAIKFSNRIFEENKTNPVFAAALEEWLRSVLRYDPRKRNGDAFGALRELLSRRIVTVFSVPTCAFLSYEIDDETTLATLRSRIETDAGVKAEDQTFLSSETSGEVEKNVPLVRFWKREPSATLYLYRRNGFVDENAGPKPSAKLRRYVERPKANLNRAHSLRALIEIYDYLYKECEVYASLDAALALKARRLESEIKNLYGFYVKSEKDVCRLDEKFGLLADILENDRKHFEKSPSAESTPYGSSVKAWSDEANLLGENVSKLMDAWSQLTIRLESASRRCAEVREDGDESKKCRPTELRDASCRLIASARKRTEEERNRPGTLLEGVKLLFESFKLRDSLLSGTENKKLMQKMLNIDDEARRMNALILSAAKNAFSLSRNVSALIVRRQELAWKLLANDDPKKSEKKPVADFRIGQSVRNPTPVVRENDFELETLIDHNKRLRSHAQNLIRTSFEQHKELQSEMTNSFILLEAEMSK